MGVGGSRGRTSGLRGDAVCGEVQGEQAAECENAQAHFHFSVSGSHGMVLGTVGNLQS